MTSGEYRLLVESKAGAAGDRGLGKRANRSLDLFEYRGPGRELMLVSE